MQQLLHELKTIGDPRISEVTRRATAQIHAARDLGLDPDTRFYGLMRTQDLEWLPVSIASSLDEMSYGVDKLVSDRALKTLLAAKAAFVEFRESQGSQSIDECLNWMVSQPDFETVDTRRKLSALHGMRVISSAVGHPVVKAALDHAATKFQEKSAMIAELRTDLSEPGRDMNIALDQALHCLYTARPLPFGILATEVEADISSFLRDGTPLSGGTFGDWPLKKLAYEAAKDMLSKEDPGESNLISIAVAYELTRRLRRQFSQAPQVLYAQPAGGYRLHRKPPHRPSAGSRIAWGGRQRERPPGSD